MLADEFPDMNCKSPQSIGGSPVSMMVYVQDVDVFVERAVSAGAKMTTPVENKFYGDRFGSVEDHSDTTGTSRHTSKTYLLVNWRHARKPS